MKTNVLLRDHKIILCVYKYLQLNEKNIQRTPDLHNVEKSFLPWRPFLRHLCKGSDKIQTHAAEGGLDDDHDEAGRDLPHPGYQTHR